MSCSQDYWPPFMGPSAALISNLGREYLLLRKCNPAHFLCSGGVPQTTIRLQFSTAGLSAVRRATVEYGEVVRGFIAAENRRQVSCSRILRVPQVPAFVSDICFEKTPEPPLTSAAVSR